MKGGASFLKREAVVQRVRRPLAWQCSSKGKHEPDTDDFVRCFEREDDARRVFSALPGRMEAFGLEPHPDKTRLIPFTRPARKQAGGRGPGVFDFPGFMMYRKRMRGGVWRFSCRTRGSRASRAVRRIGEYCRRNRHLPVREQYAGLCRGLHGHFNCFGVNGNMPALRQVYWQRPRGNGSSGCAGGDSGCAPRRRSGDRLQATPLEMCEKLSQTLRDVREIVRNFFRKRRRGRQTRRMMLVLSQRLCPPRPDCASGPQAKAPGSIPNCFAR